MKTIVNIAGITDHSGSAPLTTYSNAVKTVIQTPNENGKRYRYPVRYVLAATAFLIAAAALAAPLFTFIVERRTPTEIPSALIF